MSSTTKTTLRAIIRIDFDSAGLPPALSDEQLSRMFSALVLRRIDDLLQPWGSMTVIVGCEDTTIEAKNLLIQAWVAKE